MRRPSFFSHPNNSNASRTGFVLRLKQVLLTLARVCRSWSAVARRLFFSDPWYKMPDKFYHPLQLFTLVRGLYIFSQNTVVSARSTTACLPIG